MKHSDNFHISDSIASIVKPLFDKKGIHLLKLIEDWSIIADGAFKHTSPSKIVWNKDNQGILYLYSENPLNNHLAMHDKKHIIKKVNQYFNYNCIIDIKFVSF